MKKKSQAEILEKKLGTVNLYRILMVFSLVIAIISSSLAIISFINLKTYKSTLEHPDWISIIIQTRNMPDSDLDVPERYQLNVNDYGGAKVDGSWKGKTLDDFLRSKPGIFTFDHSGMMSGINGSQKDPNLTNYWWALYSSTDPSCIENPDLPANIGAPYMILQDANVYYFALHKIS